MVVLQRGWGLDPGPWCLESLLLYGAQDVHLSSSSPSMEKKKPWPLSHKFYNEFLHTFDCSIAFLTTLMVFHWDLGCYSETSWSKGWGWVNMIPLPSD